MSKTDFRKLSKVKNTSFPELSKLIVEAIETEQFFNKEVLVPKVKAIITAFKLNIQNTKYNRIEEPSDAARRLRALEIREFEVHFWKGKVVELVGKENM